MGTTSEFNQWEDGAHDGPVYLGQIAAARSDCTFYRTLIQICNTRQLVLEFSSGVSITRTLSKEVSATHFFKLASVFQWL